MATVGRIGGQVLKDNLLRQNVNLDFRNLSASTPLLKLDVVNDRVGINTTSPSEQFDINGTAFGSNIIATNSLTAAGNMVITTNGFSALSGSITISGSTGVFSTGIGTDQLILRDNRIYSYVSDAPLSLEANGTGTIELKSSTNISGNLHATGNITANGNIIIGDADDDNLILGGEVTSDIIPDIDTTYNLGSSNKKWANIHTNISNITNLTSNSFTAGGIEITQPQGNIFYVAKNGSDSNVGDHNLDPFLTIAHALQAADASTGGPVTIHISPGTYVETFPLTVPSNVTLQGHDMRNTIITPTTATESNDAILVNGESTVENITVKDFYYNSGADTGYGFRFVSNATVSTRSPYIKNCTVITKGFITVTAGSTFSVAGQETNPRGITFNNDGTKMFIVGTTGDDVNEYTLSTGFDLSSTVTFIDSFAVTQCPDPTAVKFNGDGTKMFVTGVGNSNVHQYALTTGFDVSTASFTQTLVTTVDNDNFGLDFKPDGTKMYITGNQNDKIYEYNLSSAFDISTATFNQDKYLNPIDDEPFGIEFNTDGTRIFVIGTKGNGVDEYTLSTPYDISTMEHMGFFHVGGNPSGIHISPDGSKMFIVGNVSDLVKSYDLGSNYRVSDDNDPRGYDSGNAGRGVLVDGASVTTNSKEAGMLFHAVTLITPGQQGITAKNGARVEWLNSFTYFASIGIKTEQGTTGFAGQGTKFGAEMRCIGSACVYGNKGIDADGAGSIIYLVDQNFAYIGAGRDVTNDDTLHIQANEITATNSATVSFTSLDQIGTYRVGSTLEVNQETGQTVISSSNFDFSSVDQLSISDGVQSVILNSDRVQTDFIKFSGSTMESIVGNLEVKAGLNTINISDDTVINANLDVSGSVTLGGALIRLGDNENDTVDFNADVSGDLIPNFGSTYSLGSPTKHWNTLNAQSLFLDGISFSGNRISTDSTNENIELKSIGDQVNFLGPTNVIGVINQPNTGSSKNQFIGSLTINNGLTIGGPTFFVVTGLGTHQVSGNVTAQSLKSNNNTLFDDISIIENNITTRNSNSNLVLDPAGTGKVSILSNLSAFNILAPNANISIGSASGLDKLVAEEYIGSVVLTGDAVIEDIAIADNIISTRTSNSDLILRASGSGSVKLQEDVIIEQDIITPATSNVAVTSTNNLTASTLIVQNLNAPNKNIIFEDIMFTGNKITTTKSNSNLTFGAVGSGVVKTKSQLGVEKNFEVTKGNTNFIGNAGATTLTVKSLSTTTLTGVGTSIFEGISLSGNVISTKDSNANLELRASGTGTINVQENFVITNGITVNDTITLGSLIVTNNSTANSGINVNGNFNTGSTATNFENIQIKDNVIQTTDSNSNLELRANGTGTVTVADNFNVTNTITSTVGNFSSLVSNNTATLNSFTTGSLATGDTNFEGISILGNVITTKDSNANLELRASGTGKVTFQDNVVVTNDLNVNGLTTVGNIAVQNTFQTLNLTSENLNASGTSSLKGEIDKIRIMGNHITTNVIDTDLQLRASGSGNIKIPNNNVSISNNLTVNKLNAANINIQQDVDLGSLEVIGNINVNDNFIETTVSNSDLELRANGSGSVSMGGVEFDNQIQSTTGQLQILPTTNVNIQGTGSFVIPKGTTAQENASQTAGSIRFNTSINEFVGYGPTSSFVLSSALLSDDLLTGIKINNLNDTNFSIAGNDVATFTSNNKAQILSSKIILNGITLNANNISINTADTDMTLNAPNARIAFDKVQFQDQYIHADGTGIVQFDHTGAGTAKFDQTTAMVFPVGTNANRETSPEIGTTRFNTQLDILEVYSGVAWTSAEGSSGSVSTADMEDLLNTYTIIFG